MTWQKIGGPVTPPEPWLTTLADPWRGGPPTPGVREGLADLTGRLRPWV